MHLDLPVPTFIASLAVVVGGCVFFSREMKSIRAHLHVPGHLLRLLVALGADSPEISSAIVAMVKDKKMMSVLKSFLDRISSTWLFSWAYPRFQRGGFVCGERLSYSMEAAGADLENHRCISGDRGG